MSLSTGDLEMLVRLRCVERSSPVGAGARAVEFPHQINLDTRYNNGTGANKQDAVYSKRATTTQTLDLRGSLTSVVDPSQVVSFPYVTTFCIQNHSTTVGENLTIGAGSNPFITWLGATGDAVVIGPGGILLVHNPVVGYQTTAGTGDVLTITVATGTPAFDIFVAGRQS